MGFLKSMDKVFSGSIHKILLELSEILFSAFLDESLDNKAKKAILKMSDIPIFRRNFGLW